MACFIAFLNVLVQKNCYQKNTKNLGLPDHPPPAPYLGLSPKKRCLPPSHTQSCFHTCYWDLSDLTRADEEVKSIFDRMLKQTYPKLKFVYYMYDFSFPCNTEC